MLVWWPKATIYTPTFFNFTFIFFYSFFWGKIHIIQFFPQFFTIFARFDQFQPNFVASLLFFLIFLMIISYHELFVLDYSEFIFFHLFFGDKIHIIQFFSQFFTILLILTNFGLILWRPYFIFSIFCFLYFQLPSFYHLYVFFGS